MPDSPLPPIYSQQSDSVQDVPLAPSNLDPIATDNTPQLLLIPAASSVNFQSGYLGAEGEHAAIEGELQTKGIEPGCWSKVTIALRTTETAYLQDIELASSQTVLFESDPADAILPSTLPFAIPLTNDTPQSIQTPHSSLSHILTATLHPSNKSYSPCSKSIVVHTRRYISHVHSLFTSPEKFVLDNPTRVEVEVPRTTFKVGEPIPVYITVPPPSRELVVNEGLRLRNVRTELVRVIKVKGDDGHYDESELDEDPLSALNDTLAASIDGPSMTTANAMGGSISSKISPSPLYLGSSYRTTVAQSGASCRFHTCRAIKLRQVLHQPHSCTSPYRYHPDLPTVDYGSLESDAEGGSITQFTLLHSVTFQINVLVSFVDMPTRTERVSHLSIPITMLPPCAPLPEVAQSLDEAYQKKHDRPPARTVRHEEAELAIPDGLEDEAGPSFLAVGAPPPFDERDAPPPFSSSAAEASGSARLPTFLESESEIILPETDPDELLHSIPHSPLIVGEGFDFGFSVAEQFDGHSEDIQRSATPPPSMEMATHDTDLTALTDIHQTDRALETLGLVLDHEDHVVICDDRPPPPPPAIDDPSDPPPSIDSEFRLPEQVRRASSPPSMASYHAHEPPPPPPHTPQSDDVQPSHGHAPPPYLIPDSHDDQEHVSRPPPYVD
ncbi:hypothetical protein AX17_000693 [Amanita inopinata Kibby_2008]|nr:hypothetical protein AX17_000693 [Amanita inopinata Kibby_2008]